MILEKMYEIAVELRIRSLENKEKEPVILDDVDTLVDDELSSSSSPSLSLLPKKNARESAKAKSHKSPSHHPAFSDVVIGASCRARKETGRTQN